MNNPKRINYSNTTLKCRIDDFESGRLMENYSFNNCLLYLTQPTTYSPEITLATVCFVRNDNVIRTWRARITKFRKFNATLAHTSNGEFSTAVKLFEFNAQEASILDDRSAYRELIEIAGPATAKSLLFRAHDAAALHAFKPTSQLYKKLVQDSSLHGLIVNDSEFYTYISLKLIFEEDAIGGHKTISRLQSTLSTISNNQKAQLELDFHFHHTATPFALPLNVIIGSNGVGKTRTLQGIARPLFKNYGRYSKNEYPLSNPIVVFSHEPQRWRANSVKSFKHVSLSITRSDWGKLPAITQEISLLRERNFSLSTLNNVIKKVLDTRHLYLKKMGNESTGYSLDELANQPEKCERIDISAEYKFIDNHGLEHHLSSGQRALICFCFNVVLHCRPKSILLIDEPENHLHPRFISLLIQTLNSVLLATESVAIVATHSPFIVREIDKSGVLILQVDQQNLPSLFRPSMQTLGGDISLISDFVFEDISVRKGYQESIDESLRACRDPAARKAVLEQFTALGIDAAAYARSLEH